MDYAENLTDRKLRMSYLRSILQKADKVLLYGKKECIEIFKKYLSRYFSQESANVSELLTLEAIELGSKDILMPLTVDVDEFREIVGKIFNNNTGISPLQVIPPGCFFLATLAEISGFIIPPPPDEYQLPFLATIDTVDRCNLDCKTCGKVTAHESSDKMDFELFKAILDKLVIMGIQQVELYNYTEPFLNPDILRFMQEVKRRGLTLGISTNLSLPHIKNLKECVDLLTPGDWFVITISGVNQEIYEINHKNGKIKNVIENLAEISKSEKRNLVTLRLLKFPYNLGEISPAKELAKQFGIGIQWFDGSGSPFENKSLFRNRAEQATDSGMSANSYNKGFDKQGFYCRLIHARNIVINARGNVELCCTQVTRPYDLGSFLDQDIMSIQVKRDIHPLCHKCPSIKFSQSLTDIPLYPDRINNVLQQGMKVMCTERMLHPVGVYNGVEGTENYLQKCIERLVQ